jgi:hypothetical protein
MTFEDEEKERHIDEMFEYLVEEGALELLSIDPESGEPLYRITPKCEQILPALYYEFKNELNSVIYDLWHLGIVDVRFGETSENDMIKLSAQWDEAFEENKDSLQREHKNLVYRLIDDAILTATLVQQFEEDL